IYDFVTLFLFTLSFSLLAHHRLNPYLLAFSLACLSKETSLFLILFFAIHFRGLPKRQYATLLSTQMTIYLVFRLAIMWLFRNNPGDVMEFHFYDQIRAYQAHPWQTLLFFLFIFSVVMLLVYQWKNKPLFLREAALSIGLPLGGLYIFFGMPYELRVFLEVYPTVYLLACFPFLSLKKGVEAEYHQVPV
ncbi:MAG TPA: hypothetical protein VLE49_22715, partial [Anaerolineales bacterium]|nr:hypothetical protein [Anaerolineales bacterium]